MNSIDLTAGLEQAWAGFVNFLPRFLLAIAIIVAGFFVAKLACKVLDRLLERAGFDRLVEKGGVKRALQRTRYDASDLLAKLLFYFVMLFVLQFAFGIFGPNPIGNLLTAIIAFLPNLFVAVLIVIVASAIAAAAKDILAAMFAGLSYGLILANTIATLIVATGIFAALNQINIAPAIVNGLFYALLVIVAGSAVVAIGGGGILPMRRQWEKLIYRIEKDAPGFRHKAGQEPDVASQRAEMWKEDAQSVARPEGEVRSFHE